MSAPENPQAFPGIRHYPAHSVQKAGDTASRCHHPERFESTDGMTLRDWFAGQALAGLCADPKSGGPIELFAKDAYQLADAMLAERAKK